jgi:tetratricopeptide (TPR) repeat protein
MSDNPRIDDLRRRVQKDPASIAFAQLGEEYRRAGQFQEAADVCRAGLAIHPGYLSAHVTLGRTLIELHDLAGARVEFETVLKSAPENLAALRGLAEVLHKSGLLSEALVQYRLAQGLARNDPDLERMVGDLTRELAARSSATTAAVAVPFEKAPAPAPAVQEAPPPAALGVVYPAPVKPEPEPEPEPQPEREPEPVREQPAAALVPALTPAVSANEQPADIMAKPATSADATEALRPVLAAIAVQPAVDQPNEAAADSQVKETIEALEQWLDAIHVSRANRSS